MPERKADSRGERRRDAILDAAVALLAEEGFGALSHRAVATRAGVPLAATTYYFRSREDLVGQAVARAAAAEVDRARAVVAALPDRAMTPARVATALVALVTPAGGTGALVGTYERYLQAGRSPALRPAVQGWNAELVGLVREVLRRGGCRSDRETASTLLACVDGLLIYLAVEDEADVVAAARKRVRRLVEPLRIEA